MRTVTYTLSLAFIFCIPWEGVIEFSGLGTAARVIGLAVAACWVATVAMTGRFRRPGPFHIAVGLFVVWNAVSVVWSAEPSRTVLHVQTWVQVLGMVLILWEFYTTRSSVLAGLQAFILGEYLAIGSTLYNYVSGNVFYTHYQRFSPSDQSNPDGFGIIVVLGIPVAWYLATLKSDGRTSRLRKLVNYAYIPAAFVGLALSGTRTALIAALPGMAFGLASLTRIRTSARVAIFLFLAAAILLVMPYVQSLRSFQRFRTTTTEITEGDLNARTTNWRQGLTAFTQRPLLGVGGNMYRSINSMGKLAHNSFISVLVELGLPGFVLFALILMMAVLHAWDQPAWDARFWLTMLLVWAICASSLTYEHRKATWLLLSYIVASAAVAPRRHEAAPRVQDDWPAGGTVRQHAPEDGSPLDPDWTPVEGEVTGSTIASNSSGGRSAT